MTTKQQFKLKIEYKNNNNPLVFIGEGTLKYCCKEILDILCDEICSITITNLKNSLEK